MNWLGTQHVELERSSGPSALLPAFSLCDARENLAAGYRRWQRAIRTGLGAMADRGEFLTVADIDRLATALLTTLQGGLLLTKTMRDPEPLETALSIMIDHIESIMIAKPRRS